MLKPYMNTYNDSSVPLFSIITGVDGIFIGYVYGVNAAVIGGIIGFGGAILTQIAMDHGPNQINAILNIGL